MEDRKLYHLVNGEFVLNGMPSVHVQTYAEVSAHIAILQDVGFFDNPIAESVPAWDGLSNGRRNTEKQASLYDAMLAEIYAERNKAKARRVRKPDNRTRAERLADWEEEKLNRKDRRAQYACNHINKKYGYLCIEQERRISAEKVARADYEIELRNIADDAEQMKIEAEYAEWERRYRHEKYMRNLNDWLKYA